MEHRVETREAMPYHNPPHSILPPDSSSLQPSTHLSMPLKRRHA
eukprot:CAMPEP_0181208490 /NCGR_PEP_ID=MMETSP1096-20121128/22149_1 /TAXON_ID=156174 ORGANISM="Chrysochromulina ericina, Strain CCMP281" /NCGR_SAMPLE_ID=MMETSP1096 /ASSEMBLY_ACC=CAM_ASM_000453 /LENGTH=43 /DNA_ID= /DNA_START= /DNA_END= /DNA_ORIENTATION=